MLPEESDHVSVDRTQTLPKTQKRMAQRRLEPIVAKHEKRTRKTNLNSFKEKYLNLKKKLSALQIEVGASEDFLLIVKNNLQVPSATQQSPTAGKYMIFGAGAIADRLAASMLRREESYASKLIVFTEGDSAMAAYLVLAGCGTPTITKNLRCG